MKPIELVTEETQAVAVRLADVAEEARAIQIRNDMEYAAAGAFLRDTVKAMLKAADEAFDPIVRKAHETHKEAVSQKKKATASLLEAEQTIKRLMGAYQAEQERKRLAAEVEARRKAQEEAERERLEQAAALESAGHADEAEALITEPITAQAVVVDMPRPEAAGISVRRRWDFRVVDARKLKPEYLIPDETKIRGVVRALGADALAAVGEGALEIFEVRDVAVR